MSDTLIRIRTALLSVSDKTDIVPLATALSVRGVELISTGGTASTLRAAGLTVRDITEITGHPEAFGGRMKTLSFHALSAILFDRERDANEATALEIAPIDLVVANLYPFEKYQHALPLDELVEYIDIGGPTMIRAAAKNAKYVTVLSAPADYSAFMHEFAAHDGHTLRAFRTQMMVKAFALTTAYDEMVSTRLADLSGMSRTPEAASDAPVQAARETAEKAPIALRYGENPHQKAVFHPGGDIQIEVLGGKALSYNNLVDLDAALSAVIPLDDPACAIVKHENPCGLATSQNSAVLLRLAWQGDPTSSFGSVIAFNRPVGAAEIAYLDMPTKEARKFVEIVAAPSFTDEALALLAHNKNLRVVKVTWSQAFASETIRTLRTGRLTQDADTELFSDFVGETTALDIPLALFGLHAVKMLKSNAIALVHRTAEGLALLGMGAGQPNRIKSTELAISQARENLARSGVSSAEGLGRAILASDAFFPFADSVQIALEAGVRVVLQPGGSIRDSEVKEACEKAGATLILTGMRHFKH